MLTENALAFLRDELSGHQYIRSENTQSELVSLSKDSRIESLEQYQAQPNRIKQVAKLHSCRSFCDYVNRFKVEPSTVYLDAENGKFAAVIDHPEKNAPAWRDHRALFEPKCSLEWSAWTRIHQAKISQLELAHFIEERLDDIHEPEPNTMLKAALDFESNEKLVVGSATNLDDGSTRFTFQKDNVRNNVTFPHKLTLRISVHENEEPQTLNCRIRYRVSNEGVLTFVFSFVQDPRQIVRDALLELADKIRGETEGLHQYEGRL